LKEDFSDDIREQFDKLKAFRDPRAFNGIFTHVYARLWSVYKNIVFFSLAQRGKPEFAKKKALNLFYRFYPNLRRLRTSFDGLYYFYCIAFKDVDLPHPHIHQTQKQLLKYLSMFNILERGLK
jgi:hypothetical protein